MIDPPERWHGGWIVALWVAAAVALVVALQLFGPGGGPGESQPRSHSIPFFVAVGSLLLVAVPFYCTQRWIERRGRGRGEEDEPSGRPGEGSR